MTENKRTKDRNTWQERITAWRESGLSATRFCRNHCFCLWLKRLEQDTFPWPKNRKEIVHDIPEEEKVCTCGDSLTKIGEEVSLKAFK
jgi:hypothetical protein